MKRYIRNKAIIIRPENLLRWGLNEQKNMGGSLGSLRLLGPFNFISAQVNNDCGDWNLGKRPFDWGVCLKQENEAS